MTRRLMKTALTAIVVAAWLLSGTGCTVICISRPGSVKRVTAMAQVEDFVEAAKAYKQDVGSFPANLDALSSAPPHAPGWNGPYVQRPIHNDPWGRPYIYRFGPMPEIGSYGADGKPGGEGFDADIFMPVK